MKLTVEIGSWRSLLGSVEIRMTYHRDDHPSELATVEHITGVETMLLTDPLLDIAINHMRDDIKRFVREQAAWVRWMEDDKKKGH